MGRKDFKLSQPVSFLIKKRNGMTLIEALVVLAIVAIMILLVILSLNPRLQIAKANDSRRKSDLKRISTALEDFAGDHPCYPSAIYTTDVQENKCKASDEIDPYLRRIPCDPKTGQHYPYTSPDGCSQFAIYASLELEKIITYGLGNYALTSPNLRILPTVLPTPTEGVAGPTATAAPSPPPPTSTPVSEGNFWGCFDGACLPISGREQCPNINYQISSCGEQCIDPNNECH